MSLGAQTVKESSDIRVSFCITCKGRLHHLQQTLPVNILANSGGIKVEFVLLDYSSPDGLADWVRANVMKEIEVGRIVYYGIKGAPFFVPAHAKNVAHRLARGEILCNLDADNFCGEGFADYLDRIFSDQHDVFVRSVGIPGVSGRIAFLKKHFEMLRGYDEGMELGWGYDDIDISQRAICFGLREHVLSSESKFLNAIQHDDSERTMFTQAKQKRDSHYLHRKLSRLKISLGMIYANSDERWGAAIVEKNFKDTFEI